MKITSGAPGSQASLREMNRLRIVDAVREHGALTQVEIASVTGLSAATVSNLVRDLDGTGAVTLSPTVRNGRRAVQVSLSAASGLRGAIVFGARDIRAAVSRGDVDIISRTRMPLAADHAGDEGLYRSARLLSELVESSGHAMDELGTVVIGLPAPIDTDTGKVGSDGILPGWRGVRVAHELGQALATTVHTENTANLAALAELRFGSLRGVSNALYVNMSHGIGAGIVVGGALYRGANGVAGELGHVTVERDGPLCRCGNRGCLEVYAGSQAILDGLPPQLRTLTLRDVVNRAGSDDDCHRVLTEAARQVGVALASTVNVLNPEVLSIGGQLAGLGDIVLGPLADALDRRAVPAAVRDLRLVPAELGPEDAEVVGALALADQEHKNLDFRS